MQQRRTSRGNRSNYIKDVRNLDTIRIIVNPGRGQGHQRAAITLMERLREMGFKGIFDVRYDGAGLFVERTLQKLIPGFLTEGEEIVDQKLGKLRITRLPFDARQTTQDYSSLPQVVLAMTAADDWALLIKNSQKFASDMYIGLQPTDWHQGRHIAMVGEKEINLEGCKDWRLSSTTSCALTPIDKISNVTDSESRALTLVQDKQFYSQLVYGLYPERAQDPITQKWKQTGNLSPITLCFSVVYAYHRQRREKFLERLDACEQAMDALNIKYETQKQPSKEKYKEESKNSATSGTASSKSDKSENRVKISNLHHSIFWENEPKTQPPIPEEKSYGCVIF